MAILVDNGTRHDYSTGAMREAPEGKGRCDLLPLDVIAFFLDELDGPDPVLLHIDNYIRTGDIVDLYRAVDDFCEHVLHTNQYTACLEVAKHYEDGARKYADRNWEKGLPLHSFMDSGIRHYLKHLRGDTDEPHSRAFVWNMFGAIWTHKHHPELIDLPFTAKETT